ncbi:transmembrane protein 54-like isoform X2 [Varanus komodoensis]|uniref:transmembrane protein 54-like isoform X2 n=1 Tax=Varanus komodoensis TaxID=61221 RepID=UPI001CF78BFC|nr:transmembrane protein 54-like isoform X2 [Varanus komodoensis]
MCRLDNLDASSTQKLLMKTGLILIVIGHLNFITGALVHGTVLRHIANPQDTISLQYAISNIIIVISAIVTISCGIAAIALSRYASQKLLRWAVLSFSTTSALLSLFCAVGLVVAIAATFANKGRALLAVCTFADMDFIQIAHECPFDPTRVYSSALALWGLSLLLDVLEIIFSIRCFLVTLVLLNPRFCCRTTRKKKVSLQLYAAERRDACESRDLLRGNRTEAVWL